MKPIRHTMARDRKVIANMANTIDLQPLPIMIEMERNKKKRLMENSPD